MEPLPPLPLNRSTTNDEIMTYLPKSSIRWLGIIPDLRLNFDQHIQHLAKRDTAVSTC